MKARFLYVAAAALAAVGFASPPRAAEPQRWALVVGVGDYIEYGDEQGGDLPGAANDARGMRDVLVARWGFRPENVRLLLDSAATRAGIERGMREWLPASAKPGDLVVVYFSGHGSQVVDTDRDETDGLDETLCPADALRRNGSRDIRDDELAAWIRGLPTRNVTVILDSCHSGTATRGGAPYLRTKSLTRDSLPSRTAPVASGSSTDAAGEGVLEISAAQADQFAVESVFETGHGGAVPGGAFTTPLVRYLWQVPEGTSYQEVFRLTREAMRRGNFTQNPQISDAPQRFRSLFGGAAPRAAAAPGATAVRVLGVAAEGGVELDGGARAGIATGTVFRAGAALLQVTAVEPGRARARVLEGGAPAAGTAAEMVAARVPQPVLRVSFADLAPENRAAVQAALPPLPHVAFQTDVSLPAHLLLRPDADGYVLAAVDGTVRHRVAATEPRAVAASLAPVLRRERAVLAVAALENPAHPFAVAFAFAADRSSFRVGEQVAFRIRSPRDGYLTVVDVDPAGRVSVVYPNAFDAGTRLRAGQEVVLPSPESGFVFTVEEPTGRGVVRAFVTDQPLRLPADGADLSVVDALPDALRAAAGPAPAGTSGLIPVGSWATASVLYEFTR